MPQKTSLTDFPRPNVAIDLAILTVAPVAPDDRGDEGLCVLVQDRPEGPALPGRFIRERRTIAQTIAETMAEKVGVQLESVEPTLLRVFDAPDRDPRAWTLSIAHAVSLPHARLSDARGRLVPIDRTGSLTSGESLLFDHDEIVALAADRMRERYETAPDPDRLLPAPFTLAELRRLHEAVLGEPLRKDTFNRRMSDLLEPVYELSGEPSLRRSIGRPAQLFEQVKVEAAAGTDRWRLPRG